MMESEDLARVKHVGPSRKKLLHDHGITTIQQLHEMSEEKLAGIKSIGKHYAKLLKNSVNEYSKRKQEKLPARIVSAKERKIEEIHRDLQRNCNKLNNILNRLNEDFKPLGKGKHLELYVNFKKTSREVNALLTEIGQRQQTLSRKIKKNIIRKISDLTVLLNKAGKKPKKKKFDRLNEKIKAFSSKLQNFIP